MEMKQMRAEEILKRIPADFDMSFHQGERFGGGAGYYAYLNHKNNVTSIRLCAE
jgi:hypothetical protein